MTAALEVIAIFAALAAVSIASPLWLPRLLDGRLALLAWWHGPQSGSHCKPRVPAADGPLTQDELDDLRVRWEASFRGVALPAGIPPQPRFVPAPVTLARPDGEITVSPDGSVTVRPRNGALLGDQPRRTLPRRPTGSPPWGPAPRPAFPPPWEPPPPDPGDGLGEPVSPARPYVLGDAGEHLRGVA